jgi:hypothetical protein
MLPAKLTNASDRQQEITATLTVYLFSLAKQLRSVETLLLPKSMSDVEGAPSTGSARSAGWQPAVSPTGSRPAFATRSQGSYKAK